MIPALLRWALPSRWAGIYKWPRFCTPHQLHPIFAFHSVRSHLASWPTQIYSRSSSSLAQSSSCLYVAQCARLYSVEHHHHHHQQSSKQLDCQQSTGAKNHQTSGPRDHQAPAVEQCLQAPNTAAKSPSSTSSSSSPSSTSIDFNNRRASNKMTIIVVENITENSATAAAANTINNNNINNNNINNNIINNNINNINEVNSELEKMTITINTDAINKLKSEIVKEIFCGGSLLEAVQKAKIFGDCKHFVDMPLKTDPESVLSDWHALLSSGQIDEPALRAFVETHFDEPGGELDCFQPSDFDPECGKFEAISCPSYRQWAKELHRKWPTLCRKVSDRVLADPGRYSLIALPKPFVVPGGRFREMYYWDSFFTIRGLLASGMYETVRGMIENMGSLIERFGYVPNGNRVYYLNRSQPPLLTWCLSAYYEATNDKQFVIAASPWFERELQFFQQHRSIQLPGVASPLYRYHVITAGPRPESYREDVESATHIDDLVGKQRLWGDIAAAAESGRDFSSRWFAQDGPAAGKMGSTRTSSILPVDLNAIICGNLRSMAILYDVIEDTANAEHCRLQFDLMRQAIHQIFWSEEFGCWFDYDIVSGRHANAYMDTNFFPLFTACTHDGFDGIAIARYLSNSGVLAFPGGLPSSMIASGQQWDFPNAWAPTTWVVIQGLRASGQLELARQIAEKWIKRNYDAWINSGGHMFEKYNVASQCCNSAASGGEYEVQEGFGWTNGVVLDLLLLYASDLMFKPDIIDLPPAAADHADAAGGQKEPNSAITIVVEDDCSVQ